MLLMQFILEIVKQFADTLHVYEAEQNCCQMKFIVKQKCIFSSWGQRMLILIVIITSCGNALSSGILIPNVRYQDCH